MRVQNVEVRRGIITDWLRAHPLSTAREIADGLLTETGGPPALLTGAVFIPQATVYADLRALEREGRVGGWRDPSYTRTVGWQVIERDGHA